jgi:hypothetical protein
MITSLYTDNKILTTFEDLSAEIYQELDNLSYLNDELFDYYCNELFYPDDEDEMILETCTPEVLLELRQIVDDNR